MCSGNLDWNPDDAIALAAQALPCSLHVCGRSGPTDESPRDSLNGLIAAVAWHDHSTAARVENCVHLCDRVDGVGKHRDQYDGTEGSQQIKLSARIVESFGSLVHAVIVAYQAPPEQPSNWGARHTYLGTPRSTCSAPGGRIGRTRSTAT